MVDGETDLIWGRRQNSGQKNTCGIWTKSLGVLREARVPSSLEKSPEEANLFLLLGGRFQYRWGLGIVGQGDTIQRHESGKSWNSYSNSKIEVLVVQAFCKNDRLGVLRQITECPLQAKGHTWLLGSLSSPCCSLAVSTVPGTVLPWRLTPGRVQGLTSLHTLARTILQGGPPGFPDPRHPTSYTGEGWQSQCPAWFRGDMNSSACAPSASLTSPALAWHLSHQHCDLPCLIFLCMSHLPPRKHQ